MADNNFNYL